MLGLWKDSYAWSMEGELCLVYGRIVMVGVWKYSYAWVFLISLILSNCDLTGTWFKLSGLGLSSRRKIKWSG